ncbi:hypothetical protein [Streptomyces venezuelae]
MAAFDIIWDDKTVHTVIAAKVCYSDAKSLFTFYSDNSEPVAWAPALSVHLVVERAEDA